MRRRGRSYGSCRTWPAISRLSGRLRSWINKRRPRAIRRRRQRCRKRNGNYLLVSQESVRRAASRLPLVGRGETAALRRSKPKTSYEGKPNADGGRRLPPVGRPRSNSRGADLKRQTTLWKKTNAIGGRRLPPVGRPRSTSRVSALKPHHAPWRKTIAIGGRRPPPVGRPRSTSRVSALKPHNAPWRKTIAIGGRRPPPVGRPRRSKSNQKGDPSGGVASLQPPGSFFNEKMLRRDDFPWPLVADRGAAFQAAMPPFVGAFFLRAAALFRPGDRPCHRTLRDVPFAACRYAGQLDNLRPIGNRPLAPVNRVPSG